MHELCKKVFRFTDFPLSELRDWMIMRYIDHIPTVELIHLAKNVEEREEIALVSLLDLDDDTLFSIMPMSEISDRQIMVWREIAYQLLAEMQFALMPRLEQEMEEVAC